MEWPRVKSILIVLLAIVNVFLFIAYTTSAVGDARAEEENINHTVSVLQKCGFSIDKEIIPRKGTVLYPVRAQHTVEGEVKLVHALIGEAQGVPIDGGSVYANERGEVTFKNGGVFEMTLSGYSAENENDALELMRSICEKMNTPIAETIEISEENGSFKMRAVQTVIGVPIYNCTVLAETLPDGCVKLSGRILSGKTGILRSEEPHDISGLLINLVEQMEASGVTGGEIEAIAGGFRVGVGASDSKGETLYAVPVWKVTAAGEDFYINAMNGNSVIID